MAGAVISGRAGIETLQGLTRCSLENALVASVAAALTVTLLRLPVSTSQAVVGAVLGIGLVKGVSTVRAKTLGHILLGWLFTPLVACVLALAIHFAIHLRYIP